jgi:hypothetical protein
MKLKSLVPTSIAFPTVQQVLLQVLNLLAHPLAQQYLYGRLHLMTLLTVEIGTKMVSRLHRLVQSQPSKEVIISMELLECLSQTCS